MDIGQLQQQLIELKQKHDTVEKAWKTRQGNKDLLEFLVEVMPRALEAERCSIFILDPFSSNAWVQAGTGLSERQVTVPTSGSIVGRVISEGKTLVEYDMEGQVGAHDLVASQTGFVTRSMICIPVPGVTRKQVVGAIQVLNKKGSGKFTKGDLGLLEKLVFVLQMHVENIYVRQELARMMEVMKKQIDELSAKLHTKG